MQILQSILNALNGISPEAWSLIIDIVISAVAVSPLVLGIKKWFAIHSEKVMTILVILGSMGASALVYLQSVPEFAPWFVAVQGMLVYAASQPVYFFFVKPLAKRLSAEIVKAKVLNEEIKSAAIPATGLPLATDKTAVDIQDFTL